MWTLRSFKHEDTAAVLELANRCAAFDGSTSEADLAVTTYFPDGFWVAEVEDRIVGFAYGYFRDVPSQAMERWGATKVGYVALMAVAPEQRRKGIGESLLRRLLQAFKEAGADFVLLDCPAEAVEAERLYDKVGFAVRFKELKMRL